MGLRETESERQRRGSVHSQFGPLVWIAILLASWFVIVDWRALPDLASATMAAIP
jgi:hypothetical protein